MPALASDSLSLSSKYLSLASASFETVTPIRAGRSGRPLRSARQASTAFSRTFESAREFFIRNADRILFGSDQVSGDDRDFDFLASRFWCHRKLWETAYIGPSPIFDPDLPEDQQPIMHGLALPDPVLQKLYHDNAVKVMGQVGLKFGV